MGTLDFTFGNSYGSGSGSGSDVSPDFNSYASSSSGDSYNPFTVDVTADHVPESIGSYGGDSSYNPFLVDVTGGHVPTSLPNPTTSSGGFNFGNFLTGLANTAVAVAPLFVHQPVPGSYHAVQQHAAAAGAADPGADSSSSSAAPATNWTPYLIGGGVLAAGLVLVLYMRSGRHGR